MANRCNDRRRWIDSQIGALTRPRPEGLVVWTFATDSAGRWLRAVPWPGRELRVRAAPRGSAPQCTRVAAASTVVVRFSRHLAGGFPG